jgi:two-component system, NtrC family, response regulator AtoC
VTPPSATILVADDDAVARDLLAEVLTKEGHRVRTASGGVECLDIAASEPIDLAILDLRMPDLDGLAVMRRLTASQPGAVVLILTAFATMDTAIGAIRAGAYDYISKPFRMEEIKHTVRRTLEAQRLTRENRLYRQELSERYGVENLVGQAPEMVAIYKTIARVANLDTTVLVLGESGTGKEMVARAIHYASPRAGRAFVVVDCAALPETLFESELFGHERGAFTGAVSARRGLFEAAEGGTCLLDEVGELSPALQAKLLRALHERTIRRVGGNDVIPLDVRIIAATNRDLKKAVEEGRFREDLYYRLNVVTIEVPPLRERYRDIPMLAQHLLAKFTRATGKPIRGFARETLAVLSAYHWPGNVRQLEHAIESAVALSASAIIVPDDLPPEIRAAPEPSVDPRRGPMTLDELKHWYVAKTLEEVDGNKARAAELLGIDRRTLYRILERQPTDDEAPDR